MCGGGGGEGVSSQLNDVFAQCSQQLDAGLQRCKHPAAKDISSSQLTTM